MRSVPRGYRVTRLDRHSYSLVKKVVNFLADILNNGNVDKIICQWANSAIRVRFFNKTLVRMNATNVYDIKPPFVNYKHIYGNANSNL